MESNINEAEHILDLLTQGSTHLIQAVDGKALSGAAFTAGKGLFEELVIPTISRVKSTIDALKNKLDAYKSADWNIQQWALIDSDIQEELIVTLRTQVSILQLQIETTNDMITGSIAQTALENLQYENNSLEQMLNAYQKQLSEAEAKLQALYTFQSQVNGLFSNTLTELKIAMQGVTILNQTVVDTKTGSYKLPVGIDSSWFTSEKKQNVVDFEKNLALKNGREGLYLSDEGRDYYDEAMRKALKDVPPEQWAEAIKQLNQLLLFDDEGNIIAVSNEKIRTGMNSSSFRVYKNGVFDSELTLQLGEEITQAQQDAFTANSPELLKGLGTMFVGVGLGAIDLGGTAFSGGVLALVGTSEAVGGVSFSATVAGGAIIGDAIGKWTQQGGGVQISFAKGYNDVNNVKPPSRSFGQKVSGRVNGRKVDNIRVDAEPQSGKVQVQSGGGKSGYNLDLFMEAKNITDKKSIADWVKEQSDLKGLKSGAKQEIVNNMWSAYKFLTNGGK